MEEDSQLNCEGLIQHLTYAFQSGENNSCLIAKFLTQTQKAKEIEEAIADELQFLVCKIIVQRPYFRAEANNALKHQNANNLWDQYFSAITHCQITASPETKSLTRLCGQLV